MDWKKFCVMANDYEEALKKWCCGETVYKEEEDNKRGMKVVVRDNTVTVTLGDGRTATARCHPDDNFDILVGVKTAIEKIEKKYHTLTDSERATLEYMKSLGCVVIEIQAPNDEHDRIIQGWSAEDTISRVRIEFDEDNTDFSTLEPHQEYNLLELLNRA